jgi:Cys-tRNA(Pro)/Cys-tRNA(Cys) deacylase
MKTNAARMLDAMGISYEIKEYEVDPDDLAAESVARKGCFAVVPGDQQLDLKALAQLTGDKKIDTVALKEVQPLTGYIRGGVTALAAKKTYPVFADETIELFDVISISSAMRGAQILLTPADYLRATGARVGPIAKEK